MNQSRLYGPLAVSALDTAIVRVERLHGLVAGFARAHREQGADRQRTYAFVRALNKELGDSATIALRLAEGAKQLRALARPQ